MRKRKRYTIEDLLFRCGRWGGANQEAANIARAVRDRIRKVVQSEGYFIVRHLPGSQNLEISGVKHCEDMDDLDGIACRRTWIEKRRGSR